MAEGAGRTQTTTEALAKRIAGLRFESLPKEAVTVAKQCLLDFLGVAIGGRSEPLMDILLGELDPRDAGASLIGRGRRAPIHEAVLINGAMGHALDFDDVIMIMTGHATVPVAPVVLALAEQDGASGAQVIEAFVAGVETQVRIGQMAGPSHYAQGWHPTGTFGTFGAMVAAARMMDLKDEPLLHAFGLAGAQAAGIKSMFGTMAKPLHAGKAAQNGLLAARLAARGFTAHTDVLGVAQGFLATHSDRTDAAAGLAERTMPYVVETLFKYHAACYLTHAAIEAAGELRRRGLRPEDIEAVTVRVDPGHLTVCNISRPRTGLECKFSLRMTTALALAGEDTFQEELYTDRTAVRPDLVALCERTTIEPTSPGNVSVVEARLKDGRTFSASGDVSIPERDLARQQEKLESKFLHLSAPALGEIEARALMSLVNDLEQLPDTTELMSLARGTAAELTL